MATAWSPDGSVCPICSGPGRGSSRYPAALCERCQPSVRDRDGQAVEMFNEGGTLLKDQGESEIAEELRAAIRKIARDEGRGLLHLHALTRRIRGLHLSEARAQERARQLGMRLRAAVADRAEQLELLPFR